jgi:hypothetical protein
MPFIDSDGLARNDDKTLRAPFVDSFQAVELVFPGASVICLRLYEATEHTHGASSPDNPDIPEAAAIQARMSSATARRVARELLALADALDAAQ